MFSDLSSVSTKSSVVDEAEWSSTKSSVVDERWLSPRQPKEPPPAHLLVQPNHTRIYRKKVSQRNTHTEEEQDVERINAAKRRRLQMKDKERIAGIFDFATAHFYVLDRSDESNDAQNHFEQR